MKSSKSFMPFAIALVTLALAMTVATPAQALPLFVRGAWTFDSDTAGSAPSSSPAIELYPTVPTQQSGWSLSGDSTQEVVVNGSTVAGIPTQPNALQLTASGASTYGAAVTFPAFNLNATSQNLEWTADVYVDHIDANDSAGWGFRMIAQASQIDAGFMRILKNNAAPGGPKWRLYNGLYSQNSSVGYSPDNFNFDQWYNIHIVIDPDSTSAGHVFTYVNNVLEITETYTGKNLSQTQAMSFWDVRSLQGSGGLMYIDNLIVSTPEPTSVALLAIGGLAMLRRPRASRRA